MRILIYAMPVLGALAAAFIVLLTMGAASSAPQEAAGYAMAAAVAVVPYVLARSIDLAINEALAHQRRQTAALEQIASKATSNTCPGAPRHD